MDDFFSVYDIILFCSSNTIRESQETARILEDEKSSMEKIISGLKSKNSILREDLLDAQRSVADLTVQLTSSFEAREEAVKTSVK